MISELFSQGTGWLIILAYAAVMIGITALLTRFRGGDKEGFLVANREVGALPMGLSIAATWIWAPALFVAAQQAYNNGLAGVFWFTVPNVGCLILFAFFAHMMRHKMPNGFTLSEYMRNRFGNRVHVMYLIELVGLGVFSTAVQILAGSAVITLLTGIPFLWVSIALTLTALAYSFMSGMRGSVITDYVQMLLILGVGFLVIPAAISAGGGWEVVKAGLGGVSGKFSNVFSADSATVFWGFGLATTIGLLSGPFGDQTFWQRAFSTKKNQVIPAFIIGAVVFGMVPVVMSLLGFLGAGMGVEAGTGQFVNLQMVVELLPAWVAIPFTWMLLSGLISTLDSNMAAIGSMAGHDLMQRFGWNTDDGKVSIKSARVGMVALSVLGILVANIPGIQIVHLFLFYGTLRASTLLPTVIALLVDKVSERGVFYGVLAAIVVGLPIFGYGNFTGNVPWSVAGSLLTILLSGGITLALSAMESKGAAPAQAG